MKYINEEEINAIRENANIVDVIESYGIKLEKKVKITMYAYVHFTMIIILI